MGYVHDVHEIFISHYLIIVHGRKVTLFSAKDSTFSSDNKFKKN